ncbi:MAG: hypothetical protein LBG73_06560 [Spirochaetaceae bacterium]|jgi:hypothetical protein|nr:hypothetical protein [Spirochaetaceae bacterium]
MTILIYLWQFPQYILGALFSTIWTRCLELKDLRKVKLKRYAEAHICIVSAESHRRHKWLSLVSGVSFGPYICLNDENDENDIRHELGHSIQSLYLGPLYLAIAGIPSVCNNVWDRRFHKRWTPRDRIRWYYSRFPENWADKLGGVNR